MIRNKQELETLYRNYEADIQDDLETEETSRLRRQIIELTDDLEKELTEEQRQKLEHILETENELCAEEFVEVFVFAFRLAIKLFAV